MNKNNIQSPIVFDADLVNNNLEAKNKEEALKKVGFRLIERGLVKNNFIDEVIKREEVFPTGIKMGDIGVAIPHTDIEFVNQASITIGVLKEPVTFQQMVSDEDVTVHIIFMLAISEPSQQLTMLQKLMELLQDGDSLKYICNSKTDIEIVDKIKWIINDEN